MVRYKFDEIAINSTEKKKPVEEDKYTYLGLDHLDSGTLKVSRFGADVAPIGEKLIMRKGDVLFGKRRAYQKKVAIAPFDGIFSAHGMVLRPRTDVIRPKLFPFFVSSNHFLDEAIKISVGSLSPTINWRDLKDLEFNIPPIEKQDVLADQLWAMEETKEAYNQLLIATDALVKSQFIEMFGDENGYPKVKIEDLVDTNVVKAGKEFSRDEDIKYIDISSINNGTHQITGFTEYTFSDAPSRAQQLLRRNDILVSTVRPNLKNVAVVPYDYDNVVGSSGFCVLRSKNCLLRYLQYIVISDEFTEAMILKTTGTNYPAIRDKDVLEYLVPSPPLELQKQFSEFVEQVDKSKFALLQNIEKLEQCRNALMQKSFG